MLVVVAACHKRSFYKSKDVTIKEIEKGDLLVSALQTDLEKNLTSTF